MSAKTGALLIKIELIVTELTVNEKNQANNPIDKQSEAGIIFLQSDFETKLNWFALRKIIIRPITKIGVKDLIAPRDIGLDSTNAAWLKKFPILQIIPAKQVNPKDSEKVELKEDLFCLLHMQHY